MNEDQKAKIERIIEGRIDFKFGEYIGRGFEIIQKDVAGFVVFSLIVGIICYVINLIPTVGQYLVQLVVGPLLGLGFFIMARKLDRNEHYEFGNFFKGFDFAAQVILATVVTAAMVYVANIPFNMVSDTDAWREWYFDFIQTKGEGTIDFPAFSFWHLLLLIPPLFLSVCYAWTNFFIIFYGMDFWPAMEASRRLIIKNWFVVFAFLIVTGIIAMLGILLFCIGILFTYPAMLCMSYAAFADVTKLNQESPDGDEFGIEKHLID